MRSSHILFFLAVLMLVVPVYAADETILITNWNLSNSSCIGAIEITNSTPTTNWEFYLPVTNPDTKYFLYYPAGDEYLDWAVAGTNVTLSATGLVDGTYQIIGGSEPQMLVTYFNPDNGTCNMAFEVDDSNPLIWWNFTLSNVTNGVDYAIYDVDADTLLNRSTASNGQAIFNVTGLSDGTYWLIEYSPTIQWTQWDTSNSTCIGVFELSDAAAWGEYSFVLKNTTANMAYSIYDPVARTTPATSVSSGGNVTLNAISLKNQVYWIVPSVGTESIINPLFAGMAFVTVSGAFVGFYFLNQRRRRGV